MFRFDFYRNWMNEITWKPGSDFLPNFDICYDSTKVITLVEHKPISDSKTDFAYYYPGFNF